MTDFVEIPDDNSSDNEVQEQQPQPVTATNHAFDELRSLKSEMEFRGSLLGKTWSELSSIMTRYQAQIIQKHEQLDNSLSGADHFRLTQMENDLKKCRTDNVRLQKQVTDLESKILEKDSEIVQLRTNFHKAKNEVMMKDNLIQKLQAQMAQEAMDYQTEISALKDVLEQGDYGGDENMGPVPISSPQLVAMASPQPKRRKVTPKQPPMPRPQMSPSPRKPTPARLPPTSTSQMDITSSVKTETFQSPCRMAGPSTSGQSEMDSSYTDQSFTEPQDDGSGQEQSFFKVDEVYDDSNSGIEAVLPGHDPSTMLEMGGQEQERTADSEADARNMDSDSEATSDLFVCDICAKVIRRKDNLLRHKENVHSDAVFYCQMCERNFSNKRRFLDHNIKMHSENTPSYSCTTCYQKTYSTKAGLDYHMTSCHGDGKSHKCESCPKAFMTASQLAVHVITHTGKTFDCSTCDKRFKYERNLQLHQATCGKKPDLPCKHCGQLLKSKRTLKAHILYVHEEPGRLMCDRCGRKFSSRGAIYKHKKICK